MVSNSLEISIEMVKTRSMTTKNPDTVSTSSESSKNKSSSSKGCLSGMFSRRVSQEVNQEPIFEPVPIIPLEEPEIQPLIPEVVSGVGSDRVMLKSRFFSWTKVVFKILSFGLGILGGCNTIYQIYHSYVAIPDPSQFEKLEVIVLRRSPYQLLN